MPKTCCGADQAATNPLWQGPCRPGSRNHTFQVVMAICLKTWTLLMLRTIRAGSNIAAAAAMEPAQDISRPGRGTSALVGSSCPTRAADQDTTAGERRQRTKAAPALPPEETGHFTASAMSGSKAATPLSAAKRSSVFPSRTSFSSPLRLFTGIRASHNWSGRTLLQQAERAQIVAFYSLYAGWLKKHRHKMGGCMSELTKVPLLQEL